MMKSYFIKILSIRFKLIAIPALLLILPWFAYQYVIQFESYLERSQQQNVGEKAQAIATILSQSPQLFKQSRARPLNNDGALYVYPVYYPIDVEDDNLLDWRDYQQYEQTYLEGSDRPNPANQFSSFRSPDSFDDLLSYRLLVGEQDESLYLYIRVLDENILFRNRNSLEVNKSDYLRLSLLTPQNEFVSYLIAPTGYGRVSPYRIGGNIDDISNLIYAPEIRGRWQQTQDGYEVELKLALNIVGDKFGLAVFDVDDNRSRRLAGIVSTSGVEEEAELGQLIRPQVEIAKQISVLSTNNSRIQVIDRSQRILLSVGELSTATGGITEPTLTQSSGILAWFKESLLHPMYALILKKEEPNYEDRLNNGTLINGDHIIASLTGQAMTRIRTLDDNVTRVLESAYPIITNNQVIGSVVVDQNLLGIESFTTKVSDSLLDYLFLILVTVLAAFLLIANRLSNRLNALKTQAENTIDQRGRLSNSIIASRNVDEIGELSRSFSNILDRLSQYTHYLENMTSRLSHELRTPVTVVRSSLENLRLLPQNKETEVYIQRAEEGISRLNLILTNMSEAARLEQILQSTDKELTDLNKVIEACMNGYAQVYPEVNFEIELSQYAVNISGNADYIVQLMDKLLANAVEFSYPGKPIKVTCSAANGEASVSVVNCGPYLSESMKDRIFDSMVSLRPEGKQKQPHLGIGLHIARMIAEFHDGYIYADNLIETEGVMVVLRIPMVNNRLR